VNAAYLNYKRFQYTNNNTLIQDAAGNFTQNSSKIIQDLPQVINNFSGTVDYIQKFKNDFTFSAGGNYNKTKTDNDTKNYSYPYDLSGNQLTSQNDFNHFIYNENIYGLYVTFEKVFG
jgi:hypothetical protein